MFFAFFFSPPPPLAPSLGANCGAAGRLVTPSGAWLRMKHCRGFRRHVVVHVLCAPAREGGSKGSQESKAGRYSTQCASRRPKPLPTAPSHMLPCGAAHESPCRPCLLPHSPRTHPLAEVWRVRALRLRRRLFMRRGWAPAVGGIWRGTWGLGGMAGVTSDDGTGQELLARRHTEFGA